MDSMRKKCFSKMKACKHFLVDTKNKSMYYPLHLTSYKTNILQEDFWSCYIDAICTMNDCHCIQECQSELMHFRCLHCLFSMETVNAVKHLLSYESSWGPIHVENKSQHLPSSCLNCILLNCLLKIRRAHKNW